MAAIVASANAHSATFCTWLSSRSWVRWANGPRILSGPSVTKKIVNISAGPIIVDLPGLRLRVVAATKDAGKERGTGSHGTAQDAGLQLALLVIEVVHLDQHRRISAAIARCLALGEARSAKTRSCRAVHLKAETL